VIPIESVTEDLGDLLHGQRMIDLLAELRRRYNLILLDSAPLLAIADTRSLATLADAVIMVVRWRKTPDHAVQTALRMLPAGQSTIAGVVLSYVDMRKQAGYGYGDSTYYFKDYSHYYDA
jgi:succinoglycan biosynthesis transport protein ExoP